MYIEGKEKPRTYTTKGRYKMTKPTTSDFKKKIQEALKREYGFCPTMKQITLLEASDDLERIMARVGECEYIVYYIKGIQGYGVEKYK